MSAYFFHLAFELLQPDQSSASPVFLPPQNLDIFQVPLPAHQKGSWTSWIAPRKPSSTRRSRSLSKNGTNNPRRRPVLERTVTDLPQQAGSHIHTALANIVSTTSPDPEHKGSAYCVDWREGEISVESIDMTPAVDQDSGALDIRSSDITKNSSSSFSNGQTIKGKYTPTNPKGTEFGWGVVHLYRDSEPSPDLNEAQLATSDLDAAKTVWDADKAYIDDACTTLCILAVPTYMTPSDLLGWLGEETRDLVSHFRLVKTARSNRYMVLLKFRDAKAARSWQTSWNGKLFNSMEPENAHIVFVRSIRFQTSDPSKDPAFFSNNVNDPFTPKSSNTTISNPDNARTATSLTIKPAPPPTPALIELPTCPVCLERMDDTTGLATIFCHHVFHCACLQKWRGSGCPVCRYTQEEAAYRESKPTKEDECRVCGSATNLWICLICGHTGCGRYDDAHAFAHFEATGHSFAMDVDTQHVWDYEGDAYVHRLIQNKSDGKLVELPSANSMTNRPGDEMIPRDKVENMSVEYTHLLTSQLDSQRAYYEEQLDRAVDKASEASVAAEQAAQRALKAAEQLEALKASHDAVVNENVPVLERGKDRAEKRADKFEKMARDMQKEWREKEVINESLMDRIQYLEKQVQDATLKNSELEEQNRDLSFFISGMEKLKDQGDDIVEGTVSVADAPSGSGGGGGKKKKNKAKK